MYTKLEIAPEAVDLELMLSMVIVNDRKSSMQIMLMMGLELAILTQLDKLNSFPAIAC